MSLIYEVAGGGGALPAGGDSALLNGRELPLQLVKLRVAVRVETILLRIQAITPRGGPAEAVVGGVLFDLPGVGVDIFSTPTLQLGDIVNVSYKANGIDVIAPDDTNFIVYNINYKKSVDGPSMTVYLSEV